MKRWTFCPEMTDSKQRPKRLQKLGIEVDQRELLAEAIQKLVEDEGIDLSQIEADVSKWNQQQKKLANISTFPRKRGRKRS
jgi:MarR-like DNA-binding transcriptional regulator SgrR of sgrS sRNA